MKKEILFVVIGLLLVSFVLAAQNQAGNQGIGQKLSEQIREKKQEIKSGEYNLSLGQMLQVREIAQGLKELRARNHSARTVLNITSELDSDNKTVLKIKMANGNEKEIKIMPNTAAEKALERLRLKVCSEENNCTIELKEVGAGNQIKVSYEVQVQRHYKLLALFKTKAMNKAEVNAETGEVLVVKKPWWAFLAVSQD